MKKMKRPKRVPEMPTAVYRPLKHGGTMPQAAPDQRPMTPREWAMLLALAAVFAGEQRDERPANRVNRRLMKGLRYADAQRYPVLVAVRPQCARRRPDGKIAASGSNDSTVR